MRSFDIMRALGRRFASASLPIRIAILAAIVAAIPAAVFLISSTTQRDQEPPSPGTQAYDKFGIQKLFPTKPGGREWFMDPGYPQADGIFEVSNGHSIVMRPDGSWYSEGRSPDHRTRIMVKSPVGHELWKNVEMTGYFKVERTYGHDAGNFTDAENAFQAYARGGTHSNQLVQGSDGDPKYLNCVGSGYKGRIFFDGSVNVAKEIGHSVYAPARYAQAEDGGWASDGRNQFAPLVEDYNPTDGHFYSGKWVGLKVVIFNINTSSGSDSISNSDPREQDHVRILVYIDERAEDADGNLRPSNNWRLLANVVDAGDWAVEHRAASNATAMPTGSDEDEEIDTVEELIKRCGNPFGTVEEYASMVILWPGHPSFVEDPAFRDISNAASFRWDHAGAKFTYLSVREIDPASAKQEKSSLFLEKR